MKKLFLLASVTFSLNAFSQIPSYVPSNGLVAWYPFNGNANDESGNGHNGVTNNGAILTTDRFNNTNNAYYLDGVNDYISSTLGSLTKMTFSFWYNSDYPVNYYPTFLFIDGIQFCIMAGNNPNYIQANIVGSLSGYSNSITSNYITSLPCIPGFNAWHHAVIVYDNSVNIYAVYIDGNSCGNIGTAINPLAITAGNATFGNTTSGILSDGNAGVIGKLDDIGLWNRALTQQEITTLYNATSCANNTTISPQTNSLTTGSTAVFTATTTDPNPSYVWQSDFGQGFQTLNNFGAYSGVNTSNLSISNVQLANHLQPIRVIATSGTCIDTSNVATITISDTCIVTINDTITTLISVTDTLIINSIITSLTPPNNTNTIKVFPNPTNDHITINYGNFATMNGYTLKITNTLGQVVYTSPINQQISYLDLSTWGGNGIYFIQIINTQNNTIENRKIVLQ